MTGEDHGRIHRRAQTPVLVVLIAPDKPEISAHLRQPDGSWAAQTLVDGQLDLPAIQCQLVLDEVYEALPEA